MHIEKILLLQFAKNCKSTSSKLRQQEEVKNVSSNKNTLYISSNDKIKIKKPYESMSSSLKSVIFFLKLMHRYYQKRDWKTKHRSSVGFQLMHGEIASCWPYHRSLKTWTIFHIQCLYLHFLGVIFLFVRGQDLSITHSPYPRAYSLPYYHLFYSSFQQLAGMHHNEQCRNEECGLK